MKYFQDHSAEEKPSPTKNKRGGTKRLSTLERLAQEGERVTKVRFVFFFLVSFVSFFPPLFFCMFYICSFKIRSLQNEN